ncbi:unnamed protein product [Blepharisma stoltei]|uniref:Uncharacterized protein n=1 Tax=Blepharisma stoltei TaxID=1481888 RepID=A0AAU9JSJ2_9CILI|nr:unnamed protein product [Blepharisma stoltei]
MKLNPLSCHNRKEHSKSFFECKIIEKKSMLISESHRLIHQSKKLRKTSSTENKPYRHWQNYEPTITNNSFSMCKLNKIKWRSPLLENPTVPKTPSLLPAARDFRMAGNRVKPFVSSYADYVKREIEKEKIHRKYFRSLLSAINNRESQTDEYKGRLTPVF